MFYNGIVYLASFLILLGVVFPHLKCLKQFYLKWKLHISVVSFICILLLGYYFIYKVFVIAPESEIFVGWVSGAGLTAQEWLSFLGSYLGFSGAIVMAYLVYYQTQYINDQKSEMDALNTRLVALQQEAVKLTISEYSPAFSARYIEHFIRKENDGKYVSYKMQTKEIYALSVTCTAKSSFQFDFISNLVVFFSITNCSKKHFQNYKFTGIMFEDLVNHDQFEYKIDNELVEEQGVIFPADSESYRAFVFDRIPIFENPSRMELQYEYGNHESGTMLFCVSTKKPDLLQLISLS